MSNDAYMKVFEAAMEDERNGRWAAARSNYKQAGKMLLQSIAEDLPAEECESVIRSAQRLLDVANEMDLREKEAQGQSSHASSGVSDEDKACFRPDPEHADVQDAGMSVADAAPAVEEVKAEEEPEKSAQAKKIAELIRKFDKVGS